MKSTLVCWGVDKVDVVDRVEAVNDVIFDPVDRRVAVLHI
jgi:hypothetical protein